MFFFTPIFILTLLGDQQVCYREQQRLQQIKVVGSNCSDTPRGGKCSHPPTTRRTQCSKRGLKTITCGGGGWLHNRKSTCPHLPTWGSTLMTYGFVLIMRCFVIQPFDAYCFLVSFQWVIIPILISPIHIPQSFKRREGHMDFIIILMYLCTLHTICI